MLFLMAPPLDSAREKWLRSELDRRHFHAMIVESGEGEAFLRSVAFKGKILKYNEHTQGSVLESFKDACQGGAGLLSDGGLPCVGDPGWELVRHCHRWGIAVRTCGVHSYVMAALLMSGCDANRFRFLGFLPKKKEERQEYLRKCFADSKGETLVAIETPYRFNYVYEDYLNLLEASAWLSISIDVGQDGEQCWGMKVGEWRKAKIQLPEKPLGVIVAQP